MLHCRTESMLVFGNMTELYKLVSILPPFKLYKLHIIIMYYTSVHDVKALWIEEQLYTETYISVPINLQEFLVNLRKLFILFFVPFRCIIDFH